MDYSFMDYHIMIKDRHRNDYVMNEHQANGNESSHTLTMLLNSLCYVLRIVQI